MTSAIYGRMRMGHCVRKDYGGVLGCQADVLPVVHSFCSGKRVCEFPISDLHSTKPCPTELLSYLAASYDCVPGESVYVIMLYETSVLKLNIS
jgi:hypothetical protein